MRRLVVLVALAAAPAAARADTDGEQAGPAPTSVHARLFGTTVELTARFAFDIDGPAIDVGSHAVALPPDAVVTSAVAMLNGASHRLALGDAEHIESVFGAFADQAAASRRTWAVRIARATDGVDIDFAAATSGHVVVELSLELPGCFHRDARYVLVPASWYSHLDHLRERVKDDDDLGSSCAGDTAGSSMEWLRFPVRELATRPFGPDRIGTAAGRLDLGEDHLARVEIDLSSKLTQVPGDLHTAIVIDGSRSLSADEVETQRAIVASYLQHAPPQSHVQLIAYSRHAKALLPSWMPAGDAAPRIDREIRALAPRNGSNVDEAIGLAATWLGRATGTRRLIVIADGRFATRINEMATADLARMLPEHTLVHVADVSFGSSNLVRMDDLVLGDLAASTGGIAVAAGMPSDHQLDATMLVHPLGLDRIKVTGPGWRDLDGMGTCPLDGGDDLLPEGSSCQWWGRGDAVSGPITVVGFLWGQKITRVLRADPSQGRHLARALTTSDHIFDDDLKKQIDLAAFAVNSAWSMLVTWGGAGGYADLEKSGTFGFGRFGSSSHDGGISDTIGMASGGIKLDLKKQLAAVVAACHATKAKVVVSLETTLQEIVGVDVGVTPYDETIHTCLVDAVWNISLAIPSAPSTAHSTTVFEP